ncbi:ATP-dependent RecD-like DNA helicase [archaeon HR01]|nr:ATP-dependent RecD-like DNA helicase [archaeon HR01]
MENVTIHLSARLAWHDRGWDGHICHCPKSNVSCMVHEYIRDSRNDDLEEKNAGKFLENIKHNNYIPPCSRDIGAFSSEEFEIVHYDPLDRRSLPPVNENIPPFSFCTSPYGRMFSDDPGKIWEESPEEQERRLNEFWSKIEEGKSLVFFYVNHGNPLKEEKSDRILIGVGRILKIGQQLYFGKKEGYERKYPLWSRRITHNFPKEGVRLPYQEYIERGLDPSNIFCTIPNSARPFFSYVAEHVSDDVAVGILERVIQSVKNVKKEGKVPEPYGKTWDYRLKWLNQVLDEVWKNRGCFPSIGGVLEYLGFNEGIIYHHIKLSKMERKGINIFNFVFSILNGKRKSPKKYEVEFEKAITKWRSLPKERKELLQILTRFELSKAQIERVVNPTKRQEAGIISSEKEIIENPYVLSELDSGGIDQNGEYSPPIDFDTIDRGMIPSEELVKIKGKIKPIPLDDNRRVRALLNEILRVAALEGDSCLTLKEAIEKVEKRLVDRRRCSPDIDIILNNKKFYEERIAFYPDENPQVIALKKIRLMEEEVRNHVEKLLVKEYNSCEKSFWEDLVEQELKGSKVSDETLERRARAEKITALDVMWRFRFSILTGYAGTGKTTTLKLFIRGIEEKEGKGSLLLLAPTGKARVRLQEETQKEAQTIHQFLMSLGWIRKDTFSLKESGEKKGASLIIIDEASMIPLDLLATLFRAIDFNEVKRLILVGDPNQLPPIGCGRPFIDIIKWLESSKENEKHIARLTQIVRHGEKDSQALKLAYAFLSHKTSPGDDEILTKVARQEVSGDLEVHFWNDEKELYALLVKSLKENLGLKENDDYEGFNKSLEKPDSWQILSPTRLEIYGTTEINRFIQRQYRGGLIKKANREGPKPFGDQQMVRRDKVIQIINSCRKYDGGTCECYVANGEVGLIDYTGSRESPYDKKRDKKVDFLSVKFSTQPKPISYKRSEVDQNLELAYAITVHKSQGSDFGKVFLILPQKGRNMSKELLYTGLTRFREKLILLIEKDIAPLLALRNPLQSEVYRRNTNLFELAVRPEKDGLPYPARLIHKTRTGVLVRSKSEVVVANILTDFGISYEYEKPLYSKKDPKDFRLPDFTIKYEGETFYWEHLGMLEDPKYKEEWENKKKWYEENGYINRLIVSKDNPDGGIDSKEIEKLIKEKILQK